MSPSLRKLSVVIPVYNALGKDRDASDHLPSLWGKLVNGQWVGAGGHFSDPRFTSVYVCYSDDEGRTWQRNEDGELIIVLDWNANFNFVNEASVAEVASGNLLMIMRTGLGRLFQAWSHDDGTTWSRPMPTSLAASTTPAYIASKHAVLGLSRNIAVDYAADGVRCNCICPGITDTPMLRFHLSTTPDPDATLAARLKRVPTGIIISPAEIARAVLYLSCEDSAGVTGTSLVVDGGYITPAEWETGHTKFMQPK